MESTQFAIMCLHVHGLDYDDCCSSVALVTGFQVAITILGSGRLENYVGCLEASLKDMFMAPVKLENSSLPVNFDK